MMSLEVRSPDQPRVREYVTDYICEGRLTQLIALTGSSGAWRKTIIDRSIAYSYSHRFVWTCADHRNAFRWSAKHGDCPAGDQDLHHYIGELLYKGTYMIIS